MTITSVAPARLTDRAAIRLVCAPYAGGGTAVFHRWKSKLPPLVDLVPLCLPGHDGRLAEPLRSDLCALVSELADDLESALDRPYVLLGHSLGAWMSFELARERRRRKLRPPDLLIVAAARPPHTTITGPPLHELPDEQFISAVGERYDGIPPAISGNAELLELLLPVLRADIQMVETYRYVEEPSLDVDVLALGGTEDVAVSAAQLADWRRHTSRNCSVRLFPGGHFFPFQDGSHSVQSVAAAKISPALRAIVSSVERRLNQTK